MKLNRSILIYCIHYNLSKWADNEGKIQRRKIPIVLGRSFHISKIYHQKIIHELKELGVVTDIKKDWIKIDKLNVIA